MKATYLTSAPDQVEVSWTPSTTNEDSNITTTEFRIRIFFESGENISFPSFVTSVGLIFDEVTIGQQIFIRSESVNGFPHMYSELVNVTVSGLSK